MRRKPSGLPIASFRGFEMPFTSTQRTHMTEGPDGDLRKVVWTTMQLRRWGLRVGIFEGTSLVASAQYGPAQYMAVHEFGSSIHPARPWFRPTLTANEAEYQKILADGMAKAMLGQWTVQEVLARLGIRMQGDLRKAITTAGLVDTGLARLAVRWEVVDAMTLKRTGG